METIDIKILFILLAIFFIIQRVITFDTFQDSYIILPTQQSECSRIAINDSFLNYIFKI